MPRGTAALVRRIGARTALAGGGLAVAFLIGEGIARLTFASAPAPLRSGEVVAGQLPELKTLFELARPNVRGRFKGRFYRSNAAGFRGPDYAEQPPPGSFRIAVAGDSVTMGSGVLEEEAYPAVLERLLNAEQSPLRYEVLNLGLSGLNLKYVVQRLETVGLPFHPDLVVYGFTLNDIEGAAYRSTATPEAVVAHQKRAFRFADSPSYLLRALWPRWVSLRDNVAPRPGSYVYDLEQNYFHNPQAWTEFLAGLDRLAAIAREHDLCVHVYTHTFLYDLTAHPFRKIYDRVAAAATERGLTTTVSYELFRGRDARALSVAADDTHPNPAGHAILARGLHTGLQTLPARCWEARRASAPIPAPVSQSR